MSAESLALAASATPVKSFFIQKKAEKWGSKFAMEPVINIFFNNKEKLLNDTVRKDGVVAFKKLKRHKEQ